MKMNCNFNIYRIRSRAGPGQRSASPIAVICITRSVTPGKAGMGRDLPWPLPCGEPGVPARRTGETPLAARGESAKSQFQSQFTRFCHPDPERSRGGGICISAGGKTADSSRQNPALGMTNLFVTLASTVWLAIIVMAGQANEVPRPGPARFGFFFNDSRLSG